MSNFSLSGNYTFDRIKSKLDKNEPLSATEKQFLSEEAQTIAERVKDSHKSRGPDFLSLVAAHLTRLAQNELSKRHASENAPSYTDTRKLWRDE